MADAKGRAKYYTLMEDLKKNILSGVIKPGERIPSENELSANYAVSRHTVRKALSILENEGFVVAEHGRGTFCMGRIKQNTKSNNIAVITTYISDYIFPRLIQGIDSVLTKEGYSIILKNTGNLQKMEAKSLEDILTKNVDGLIIEPSRSEVYCKHYNLYRMLDDLEIPYVFVQGIYPQFMNKPHILMDDVEGGYLLARYLIELGHKDIIGIFKVDDYQGKARHKGYVKALQEAGIPYDPDKVIWFQTEDRENKPLVGMKQIVQSGIKFDSIQCYNDQIAYKLMQYLNKLGIRVPEDVSITGYDNSILAETASVKLTTIAHPKERFGELAAKLLLEKIAGVSEEDSKVERLLKPELIIRDSCMKRES